MNLRKRILVTGASGFLGWNICRVAQKAFEVIGITNANPLMLDGVLAEQCDITRYNDLRALFSRIKPDAVIHAAAVASPNFCQEHPEESGELNVNASITIAGLCSDSGIPCAFTSTDLVFDGTAAPYDERRQVAPINIYGEQKVNAEIGMRERLENLRICRMPLMYGDAAPPAQSFIRPFIKAIIDERELALFCDEYRTPQSAVNATEAILLTLQNRPGLYHCGGRESISRYEFALKLAKALNLPDARIVPVLQKKMVFPAPRPLNVSLDSSKIVALGFNPGTINGELDKLDCVNLSRKA